MKKLIIMGNSKDCHDIFVDCREEGHDGVAKVMDSDGRGFYIVWTYSDNVTHGSWCIGFEPLDEDEPIPEWARDIKMSLADNGYSIQYELTVPDDVQIVWIEGERMAKYIEIDGGKHIVKVCEKCPVFDYRGICQHPKNNRGYTWEGDWLDGCPLREADE